MPRSSTRMGIRRRRRLEREGCRISPSTRTRGGRLATSSGMGAWERIGRTPQLRGLSRSGFSGTSRASRRPLRTTRSVFTWAKGREQMSCIVCSRDISKSAEHRECLLTLFKSGKIQSIQEWIRLSSKPKTILKGRVFRLLERPTSGETPSGAT